MTAPTKEQKALKDAALATTTAAEFARVIDKPGTSLRNTVRGKFGSYRSKGDPFDLALRTALFAYVVEGDTDAPTAYHEAQSK